MGKSQLNKVSKSMPKTHRGVKRNKSIKKASKIYLSNKKQKTISNRISSKRAQMKIGKEIKKLLTHIMIKENTSVNLTSVGYPNSVYNGGIPRTATPEIKFVNFMQQIENDYELCVLKHRVLHWENKWIN